MMADKESNYLNMIKVDRIIDNNYPHKNTKQSKNILQNGWLN